MDKGARMRKPSEIIELTMAAGLYFDGAYMCYAVEELPGVTDTEVENTHNAIHEAIFPYNSLSGHLWLRDVHSVAPLDRYKVLVEWYLEFITELKEKEGL